MLKTLKDKSYIDELKKLKTTLKDENSFFYKISINNMYKSIKAQKKQIYKKFYNINELTPYEDIHAIRKEFKVYRYALDAYTQLVITANDNDVSDLKEIQNLLGNIQDYSTRLDFIYEVKNKFNENEYLGLKNFFMEKLENEKEKLLILKNYSHPNKHLK